MSKVRSYLPWGAKNVVRIVRLQGTIRPQSRGQGLNLQKINKHLDKAFDIKKVKPKAVCLEINSPGGSAVQSSLIYQRIRNLSKATEVPVLSFTEDYAASGGYWLALAGDEIFVDPNSVVGSIGALFGNFGFEEAIKKLGKFKAFSNSEHSLFHLRFFENGLWSQGKGSQRLNEILVPVGNYSGKLSVNFFLCCCKASLHKSSRCESPPKRSHSVLKFPKHRKCKLSMRHPWRPRGR